MCATDLPDNEQGEVIWRETFQPYGKELDTGAGPVKRQAMSYTGHRYDDDLGLIYMGARYYDPDIGRFMSVDPVKFQEGNVQSFNQYAYANNSPYRYFDPDGEWSTDDHNYFIVEFSKAHNLSSNFTRAIQVGSAAADSPEYQLSESAHMHAIGDGVSTTEQQRGKMNNFIKEKLANFQKYIARAESYSNTTGRDMILPNNNGHVVKHYALPQIPSG